MPRSKAPPTTITRLEAEPLYVALREPFAIATGAVTAARNVLLQVTLADGTVGLGEAAPFPPSGGETQETALAATRAMAALVEKCDAASWRPLAARLTASFEHQASARAGVEMAVLNALTTSLGIPLYKFLGGATSRVETDITIPIEAPEHMAGLARQYAGRGATTLKLKVGADVDDDLDRVLAVARGAPDCDLILDGNQGFTPTEAVELIEYLDQEDVRPILFEQPVHRHDLEGLRFVTERVPVPVAADESVHTAADALRVARLGAANVVNIKLMKSGIVEALDIAAVCRAAHIELMAGAMIETRLAIAAAAHLIAGLGGFRFVDLDTPMLLMNDPFSGGYEQAGMAYRLDGIHAGLGVSRKRA
jgi:L-alanine-DL-glutamate epimerase-like enolase superfamily enzyme